MDLHRRRCIVLYGFVFSSWICLYMILFRLALVCIDIWIRIVLYRFISSYMDLYNFFGRIIWICIVLMDLYRSIWIALYGFESSYMDLNRLNWMCTVLYGFVSSYMDLYNSIWICIGVGVNRLIWICILLHGFVSLYMILFRLTWICIV